MPLYRRKGYRRFRRPFRGRKRRFYKGVRKIVRRLVPKPELKYTTFVFNSALGGHELWDTLIKIPQGTDQNDRIGNKIRPVWLHIQGSVKMPDKDDTDPTEDIKEIENISACIGVIRSNIDQGGSVPSWAYVFRGVDSTTGEINEGLNAPFNLANTGQYRSVIRRHYYQLQLGGTNMRHFNFFKRFPTQTKPIMYDSNLSTSYTKNGIFIALGSDQAVESEYQPIFNFICRMAYTDN